MHDGARTVRAPFGTEESTMRYRLDPVKYGGDEDDGDSDEGGSPNGGCGDGDGCGRQQFSQRQF